MTKRIATSADLVQEEELTSSAALDSLSYEWGADVERGYMDVTAHKDLRDEVLGGTNVVDNLIVPILFLIRSVFERSAAPEK